MSLGCVRVLNMNFAYCKIDDALSRNERERQKKNKDSFATVWIFLQSLRNLHGYQWKDSKVTQRFHYGIRIFIYV